MPETRTCRLTGQQFEITDDDLAFYKRISVPPPTLCPKERERRRMVWRNERFLHKNTCGLCKKSVVSAYAPERSFPVYCFDCFFGDRWDPLKYGQDYDFSRPFFEQFKELLDRVPQLAIFRGTDNVNSDYTLNCMHNKNCYLISGADYNEDCLYGINTQHSKNCVDHVQIYDSELCYGCIDSARLYNCIGCQDSEGCSDSLFLFDCKNCDHCSFSANLRNKSYVFKNEQLSEEAYKERVAAEFGELTRNDDWLWRGLQKVRQHAIHRPSTQIQCENCTGDNIRNCKNSRLIFNAANLEDCTYAIHAADAADCHDISSSGWGSELLYETLSGVGNRLLFSASVLYSGNVEYSRCVWNCQDIFGSVSLSNHKQYVILNKQYRKDEYFELLARIKTHMRSTMEYGEFFPPSLCPFEYNRSMTNDHMPQTREESLEKGYRWYDGESENTDPKIANKETREVRRCTDCEDSYRLAEQERHFYKAMHIPEPKLCWSCRLRHMLDARNRSRLVENQCSRCQTKIETPLKPGSFDQVYCESCYLAAVY